MSRNFSQSTENGLLESPLFRELPREKLEEIALAVRKETVAPRTVIFHQGDPGDSFYIITAGKVRVFRKDEQGLEINLSELGQGESFGEMALISGEPRSANVETLEETRLIVLPKDLFARMLKDYPDLSVAFVKQISTWLLKDVNIVESEVRRQYDRPRISWFDFVLILGISLLFAVIFNHSNPNGISLFPKYPSNNTLSVVSPSSAMALYEGGEALIVDALPANFHEKRYITGAINLPLALFDIVYMMTLGEVEKDKNIVVYGGTISRPYDLEVADKLLTRGHRNVRVLEGGLEAWEKKGYSISP